MFIDYAYLMDLNEKPQSVLKSRAIYKESTNLKLSIVLEADKVETVISERTLALRYNIATLSIQ